MIGKCSIPFNSHGQTAGNIDILNKKGELTMMNGEIKKMS